MPSVRRLLLEYKISSKEIKPTGPRGHLLKGDVLHFILTKSKVPPPPPPPTQTPQQIPNQTQPQTESTRVQHLKPSSTDTPTSSLQRKFTDTEASNMRKVIAKRLTESKTQIPHVYITEEINIDKLVIFKQQLALANVKVSVNDFIIKAAGLALKKVPQLNASWDSQQGEAIPNQSIDIAVAVALDSGLITPIIKDVNNKSLQKINEEMKDLAERARTNKLKPHEYQGGSFSISNLGMFGITEFSAVINPPQGCIMAVGGIKQRVVFDESTQTFKTQHTIKVTLSYDGRAITDQHAAKWLECFSHYLSDPQTMGL